MRKKIVAGNWKMNLSYSDGESLLNTLTNDRHTFGDVHVAVFPPSVYVFSLKQRFSSLSIGLQNFYPAETGAFTGEIGLNHVRDCGADYVLIGHSERRELFNESTSLLRSKVDAALQIGCTPVFCCGEPLEIRNNNEQLDFVKHQLMEGLFHLSEDQLTKCVIAYEPIWAIGTGLTATTEQAEEMHAAIRSWMEEIYGHRASNKVSILYGGSCNATNARELFSSPNVDGGLIGGASLKAESFLQIIHSF